MQIGRVRQVLTARLTSAAKSQTLDTSDDKLPQATCEGPEHSFQNKTVEGDALLKNH